MNVDAFLDTNIIAYTYSKVPAEAAKRERAAIVMRSGTYGISAGELIAIEKFRGTPFVGL